MVSTGLNSTTRENSSPEPFVSVMLTYFPFRVSGSLVNVMSTVKPVFTALSTVAVQLRISTVPWYTGPLVLSETDTAGAGTEGHREMTMTCKLVVHIHTCTCMTVLAAYARAEHRRERTSDIDDNAVTVANIHLHTASYHSTSAGVLSSIRGTQWRELQTACGDSAISSHAVH